jgi:hypothetical protein
MRKLILGIMGATALTFASAASAQVSVTSSPGVITGTSDSGVTFSTFYGTANSGSPFDEWVSFTEALDGFYSFDLTSVAVAGNAATDVDFTSVFLTGGSIVGSLFLSPDINSTDQYEHYVLSDVFLAAGDYTLHLQGTRGRTATYSGTISFAAVPEPATWAMMLMGFGAIGFAMRRRRRPALLSQLA